MTKQTDGVASPEDAAAQERKEFRSYVVGFSLALLLTLLPFAMVHWRRTSHVFLFLFIGICALVQIVVHFRFFLHLSWKDSREDLQLILFSTLLLVIMVAGTLWIMGSLALRMGMPGLS